MIIDNKGNLLMWEQNTELYLDQCGALMNKNGISNPLLLLLQPTRLPHPWDSPGKNTGVGCHFLLECVKVKSFSPVRRPLATPWTAAHQAPLPMGYSRQEYWSGVPLPCC